MSQSDADEDEPTGYREIFGMGDKDQEVGEIGAGITRPRGGRHEDMGFEQVADIPRCGD